jgi:hypothetical protein
MSLSREVRLELMAFADGELDGQARARAEQLVAESEEARRLVEAMRTPATNAWLERAIESRAHAADGIADAVMAKLEAAGDEDGVVRLAAAAGRRVSRVHTTRASVLAALALAAGAVVYVLSRQPAGGESTPVASVVAPTLEARPPAATLSAFAENRATPSQGVEVDEIDSPSRGVSVFEIPLGSGAAAAGPSSVVIWIDDDPGRK